MQLNTVTARSIAQVITQAALNIQYLSYFG